MEEFSIQGRVLSTSSEESIAKIFNICGFHIIGMKFDMGVGIGPKIT